MLRGCHRYSSFGEIRPKTSPSRCTKIHLDMTFFPTIFEPNLNRLFLFGIDEFLNFSFTDGEITTRSRPNQRKKLKMRKILNPTFHSKTPKIPKFLIFLSIFDLEIFKKKRKKKKNIEDLVALWMELKEKFKNSPIRLRNDPNQTSTFPLLF